MPTVSVVLPVFNGAAFLRESIESILTQRFTDFELLIVNDASTDGSEKLVQSYADPRIRYFALPENGGTANAVNFAYRHVSGNYIAHIDQDDIAVPDRLGKQLRFLEKAPQISVVGGHMRAFGASQANLAVQRKDSVIKANFLSGTANIYNPTTMMRRSLLAGARFENLPETLLLYRVHATQQSRDQSAIRPALARIRSRVMAAFFPLLSSDEIRVLEPLLQWVQPPQLSMAELDAGLRLMPKALACRQSRHGENTVQLRQFLQACERRWRSAMERVAAA